MKRPMCSFTLVMYLVCAGCATERGTVGVRFSRDASGHLYARDVPPGLGAAKAGMRAGDQIVLIDGRDVRPLSDEAIHTMLSGERGARVRFTVLRREEALRFSVERTPVPKGMRAK